MIETLETGITSPRLPTLADIEQRTDDLLAQAASLARHATSAADLASQPTAALPTPEPLRRPKEPQRSLRSIFDEYALYGLAGEAVRTLAPHIEAQPEAILLQLLAAFGNVIGPSPHCSPTAAYGPPCSVASASPMAATSTPNSYPSSRAVSASPSSGYKPRANSAFAATVPPPNSGMTTTRS